MTTPPTEASRIDLINAAVDAAKGLPPRTLDLRWKGTSQTLPVVKVPLAATVLNPRSHRIRAELESRGDEADVVTSDPYSGEAQDLIARILRETKGFDDIKAALERDGGQRDPGVITHKGLLVNANTRRVALGDLGAEYIDVAVLPADATDKEITDVELDLQMETDVKQAYTFSAQLLYIEELMTVRGMSADQIGMRLNPTLPDNDAGHKRARQAVEQEMRLLRIARDVIDAGDGQVRIVQFDDDRQAFIEIDQDFEQGRKKNEPEARRVRDAQLVGLVTNVDYRKLRDVDTQLLDEYLVDALDGQATSPSIVVVKALVSGTGEPPAAGGDLDGLDVLAGLDAGPEGGSPLDLNELFRTLVATPEDGQVVVAAQDGEEATAPKASVVAAVNVAITTAIEAKRRDDKAVDALIAPIQYLNDAAKLLDRARVSLDEVESNTEFDRPGFDSAYAAAMRAVDDLTAAVTTPAIAAVDKADA